MTAVSGRRAMVRTFRLWASSDEYGLAVLCSARPCSLSCFAILERWRLSESNDLETGRFEVMYAR